MRISAKNVCKNGPPPPSLGEIWRFTPAGSPGIGGGGSEFRAFFASAKRGVAVCVLAGMLGLAIAGCGKSSDDTKQPPPPSNTAVQQGGSEGHQPPKGHD